MEKLDNENILIIDCTYNNYGVYSDYCKWDGLAIAKYNVKSRFYDMVGFTNNDYPNAPTFMKENGLLLGNRAIEANSDSLAFCILHGYIIVDYVTMYDSEDECYYGKWYVVNRNNKKVEEDGFVKFKIKAMCVDESKQDIKREVKTHVNGEKSGKNMQIMRELDASSSPIYADEEYDVYTAYADSKKYFKTLELDTINANLDRIESQIIRLEDDKANLIDMQKNLEEKISKLEEKGMRLVLTKQSWSNSENN